MSDQLHRLRARPTWFDVYTSSVYCVRSGPFVWPFAAIRKRRTPVSVWTENQIGATECHRCSRRDPKASSVYYFPSRGQRRSRCELGLSHCRIKPSNMTRTDRNDRIWSTAACTPCLQTRDPQGRNDHSSQRLICFEVCECLALARSAPCKTILRAAP